MTGRQVPPDRVTDAQARVITELARGGSFEDIANRLDLTWHTIRNTLNNARRRVGATSNVHLLALAITAGDIDPDCADGTGVTR